MRCKIQRVGCADRRRRAGAAAVVWSRRQRIAAAFGTVSPSTLHTRHERDAGAFSSGELARHGTWWVSEVPSKAGSQPGSGVCRLFRPRGWWAGRETVSRAACLSFARVMLHVRRGTRTGWRKPLLFFPPSLSRIAGTGFVFLINRPPAPSAACLLCSSFPCSASRAVLLFCS